MPADIKLDEINMIKPRWLSSSRAMLGEFEKLKNEGLIPLNGQFYPAVHYPGITMYPPINENELFKGYANPKNGLFSIYVHIPFCRRYCSFCHYPVKTGALASEQERDYYLNSLKEEIDIYIKRLGLGVIKASSVLFGGGTPTHLTLRQLNEFLRFFTSKVDLRHCRQFSYDVDPSTITGREGIERLKLMKSYGGDRITLGIQSLDDAVLKKMNRPHNRDEAIKAIKESKKAGFKLNLEFIYGFPGQSVESWVDTIKQAVELGVEEIQLYRIKIIPYGDHMSAMTGAYKVWPDSFTPIEQVILMKQLAILILNENGYQENLGRVFTKNKNDFSRYADEQCCRLYDQIGFGLTAFSSLRDRFALNTQDFKLYYFLINQGKLPINRGLIRDKDTQLRWALILPLKNREVYKPDFEKITGVSPNEIFSKKIQKLKDFGLLQEDDKTLALSTLGRFFADEVCQQFYYPKYLPFAQAEYAAGELNPYNCSGV